MLYLHAYILQSFLSHHPHLLWSLLVRKLLQTWALAHVALPLLLQTSCSWVLKESRAVYKAASEGIMNLADKFFEMERAQALQVATHSCPASLPAELQLLSTTGPAQLLER